MKEKLIPAKEDWYKKFYDEDLTQATLNSTKLELLAKKQILGLKKVLKLKKTDKILDIPCGQGRHSIRLASLGYDVHGVDISKAGIEIARKAAKKSKLDIPFNLGDMCELKKYKEQFNIVVNLFTSFGFFPTDRQNEKVMKNFVACLKPKGKFCIEIINREHLLPKLNPRSWSETDDKYILENATYDKRKKRVNNNWILLDKKTGKTRSYPFSLRIYSRDELETLMRKCGLSRIKVYNGFAAGKFDSENSSRMLLVGEKI